MEAVTTKFRKKTQHHILLIYGLIYGLLLLLFLFFFYTEIRIDDFKSILFICIIALILFVLFFEIVQFSRLLKASEKQNFLLKNSFDVLENINLYIIDRDYNYLYMNQPDVTFMEKYFHVSPKVGKNVSDYLSAVHFDSLKANVNAALENNFHTSKEVFDHEGENFVLYTSYSPIKNKRGEVVAICCITTNVTDVDNEKEKMLKLIYQDPLTEVYNRRKLNEYYAEVIQKDNLSVWVFIFDLDNFKSSNDAFGHAVGDQILIQFSNILMNEFPSTALVSRLGGDEFCVLLPETTHFDILRIQSNIVLKMQEFNLFEVSVSIGKTFARNPRYHELDELLVEADSNMYAQKKLKKIQSK
ncbi:GGDEF domain-containing protein [Streptococcus suis]|nr:GGDEF domain-containing protein [Streptococcus suis]